MTDEKREHADGFVNRYWGFESTEPLPAENGLKAHSQEGRFTQNWWGGRWVRTLIRMISSARLARGRDYARHGQVTDLDVQIGLVLARVQGTRPTPYRVRIAIKTLDDAEWERVIDAMAGQALYAAQLLNGEMPYDIEELFYAVGVSLFPETRGQIVTQCDCADMTNPCKHVAAVYLLLGEMLDEDPFVLFVLRGRTKEQIVAALRGRRADHATAPELVARAPAAGASVAASGQALDACIETFWEMGPEVREVQVRVAAPEVEMEIIKVLGDPAFAENEVLGQQLATIYRAVSRKALDVAFGEH